MPAPAIGLFFKGIAKGIAVGAKATAKTAVKTGKKIKTTSIRVKKQKIKTDRFLNLNKQYERRKQKQAKLSDKNIFSNILTNPFNIVDKVKSGLYLILFGTIFNSLPFIIQRIDKIMKRVKAAYDSFVNILNSVKDAAQSFIQTVEENKYYQKVKDFFSSGDADKFANEVDNIDKEATELEKETDKLQKETDKLERQIKDVKRGVDPRTGLYMMQYPNDPELIDELGIDTDRISFSTFIKEYNDEAVDSMVTILGLAKTITELKAELESPLTSAEKKKQIRKQLSRIQTQEYKDSIQDVSFVPSYNDDNSLKLNNNDDTEIIIIEKETVIRNGG
tara:strand:- start:14 stop:1015 length:1002 start_codon:yes stop_codon:yes gene_type:complete